MDQSALTIALMAVAFGLVVFFFFQKQHQRADDNPTVFQAITGTWINDKIRVFIDSDIALRRAKETLYQQYRTFELEHIRADLMEMTARAEIRFQRLAESQGMTSLQLRNIQDQITAKDLELQEKFMLDQWERLLEKQRRKDNLEVATYAKDYSKFELIRLIQTQMDTLLDQIDDLARRQPAGWRQKISERMESYVVFKRLKDESEKRVYVDSGPGGGSSDKTSNNAGHRRRPLEDD